MGNLNIALAALLENLGVEITQGPRPNKKSLDVGVRHAPELVCLPFKVTLGDMFGALERGADTLLFIGGGDWSCRYGYYGRIQCAIMRRLGFNFRSIFVGQQDLRGVVAEILHMNHESWTAALGKWTRGFAVAWHKSKLVDLTESLARSIRPFEKMKGSSSKTQDAHLKKIAIEYRVTHLMRMRKKIQEDFDDIEKIDPFLPLRIVLIGESYCVIEPFVNFGIIEYLGELGVRVEPFLTAHRWLFYHALKINEDRSLSRKTAKRMALPFWGYNAGGEDQLSIAYTIHAARSGFDGVIHLMPFSCMPETAALPAFERISKLYDIPFLNLSLDEHTSPTGLRTRIEAFVDLLAYRRNNQSKVRNKNLEA
jgi:predicted nucleotide-binding protein (sugar kinase/HSP70/actin superfamily)